MNGMLSAFASDTKSRGGVMLQSSATVLIKLETQCHRNFMKFSNRKC